MGKETPPTFKRIYEGTMSRDRNRFSPYEKFQREIIYEIDKRSGGSISISSLKSNDSRSAIKFNENKLSTTDNDSLTPQVFITDKSLQQQDDAPFVCEKTVTCQQDKYLFITGGLLLGQQPMTTTWKHYNIYYTNLEVKEVYYKKGLETETYVFVGQNKKTYFFSQIEDKIYFFERGIQRSQVNNKITLNKNKNVFVKPDVKNDQSMVKFDHKSTSTTSLLKCCYEKVENSTNEENKSKNNLDNENISIISSDEECLSQFGRQEFKMEIDQTRTMSADRKQNKSSSLFGWLPWSRRKHQVKNGARTLSSQIVKIPIHNNGFLENEQNNNTVRKRSFSLLCCPCWF